LRNKEYRELGVMENWRIGVMDDFASMSFFQCKFAADRRGERGMIPLLQILQYSMSPDIRNE
jgi:hypothetical protein